MKSSISSLLELGYGKYATVVQDVNSYEFYRWYTFPAKHSCLSYNDRKLWLLWFDPTLTLSYVWLSKATNMLISIITDKTKNIKYKAATKFVVNLVWDSNFCKSAWLNTDKTSCQEVLNKLEVTKRKISMDNTFTCMYLTRSHCVNRKLKIEIEYT